VSKRLAASVHSLQVDNHLLHIENNGLKRALHTKKKHKEKSNKLNLQQRQEYHSGTVFWSPRKLCEARAHEKVEQDDAEQKKNPQKSKTREMKVLETLHKKKMAEEAKAERQRAKEKREKTKKTRGEELAAPRTLKQQERDAATAQNLAIHLTMASEKPHKAQPKKTKATSCCGWWKSS
jgi:hypothetical protein